MNPQEISAAPEQRAASAGDSTPDSAAAEASATEFISFVIGAEQYGSRSRSETAG
jgi:hypothetical protein